MRGCGDVASRWGVFGGCDGLGYGAENCNGVGGLGWIFGLDGGWVFYFGGVVKVAMVEEEIAWHTMHGRNGICDRYLESRDSILKGAKEANRYNRIVRYLLEPCRK